MCSTLAARSNEPKWILVSSQHFAVLTDGSPDGGSEVALRFEQMRSVFSQLLMKTRINISEPLDIIAVKSDEEYARLAPVRDGQLTSAPGFFLAGKDRNYVVLNLSAGESWRAVASDFVRMLLNFNYPPTQPWFDEGFAEYFSSFRVDKKQAQLGADPGSLASTLANSTWMPIPELFQSPSNGGNRLFAAESWIVMHYLINSNKLSETGSYFGSVEIEHLPLEQAIQKAFGMSSAQLLEAVKKHFSAIAPQLQSNVAAEAQPGGEATAIQPFPPPVATDHIAVTTQEITPAEADARLAEMQVRLPEHRDAGVASLRAILGDPKLENATAHRALAWTAMQNNDLAAATKELNAALQLDRDDVWSRYYLSVIRYRGAQSGGQYFEGMANMMQDLHAVLDWDPEFAEAYNMLAIARVAGGGANSAQEAIRAAILLAPRNQAYQLSQARVYIAGKNWDAALALLQRLKNSADPAIANGAQKDLQDLPTLRKYGIMPQEAGQLKATPGKAAEIPSQAKAAPVSSNKPKAAAETTQEKERVEEAPAEPQPDTRKIEFLKGRLVSVDCSSAPAAIITIASTNKTLKLRTADYKSLLLIGADQFSCAWTNRQVAVNYRPGRNADGDLVSLEVH